MEALRSLPRALNPRSLLHRNGQIENRSPSVAGDERRLGEEPLSERLQGVLYCGLAVTDVEMLQQRWSIRLSRLKASMTVFIAASVPQQFFMLKLSAAKSYFNSLIPFSQSARRRHIRQIAVVGRSRSVVNAEKRY